MMNSVLFVCSVNMCRSPTAEHCARMKGLSADSAGIDPISVRVLTKNMIEQAEKIVCFEQKHADRVLELEPSRSKDILIWPIPDDYDYCERSLIVKLNQLIKDVLEK